MCLSSVALHTSDAHPPTCSEWGRDEERDWHPGISLVLMGAVTSKRVPPTPPAGEGAFICPTGAPGSSVSARAAASELTRERGCAPPCLGWAPALKVRPGTGRAVPAEGTCEPGHSTVLPRSTGCTAPLPLTAVHQLSLSGPFPDPNPAFLTATLSASCWSHLHPRHLFQALERCATCFSLL